MSDTKKILRDKLSVAVNENHVLQKKLGEAIEVIKHYDYPDVGITGQTIIKSGCVANDFLETLEENK